ncbi:septum formation protein [Aquabacterium commune]|uniref:7-methyl-GTP pyrophosphatase n=2 Tax=Aquabacterium commune TaxID=70586 RepID=A0A4R6REN7_9BURK|nr:septum formation protein [Aquabacterium commune]
MRDTRQTPDHPNAQQHQPHQPPGAAAVPLPPPMSPKMPALVLASTSVYRRDLLARLGLPFTAVAPQTDETPLPDEAPRDLALRLARAKAGAVAQAVTHPVTHPVTQTKAPDGSAHSAAAHTEDTVVIGSDQVADLDGVPLGKPGTHERAVAQLRAMRGRTVHFHTAVCVLRPRTGFDVCAVDSVAVTFRDLSDEDIDTYLRLEQPYDCAGSAKCEGLGIGLLARIASDDPTSLIGLPLILTTRLLREAGLDVLAALRAMPR